jgi:hypothetical protein
MRADRHARRKKPPACSNKKPGFTAGFLSSTSRIQVLRSVGLRLIQFGDVFILVTLNQRADDFHQ